MGRVLEAIHVELDQRVAIKCLRAETMARPQAAQRFLREARAAVKLRSENVARVIDVGVTEDGTPFMVMEHLEGEDLSALLERVGRLPAVTAVSYVLQACQAVAEAHALGIIHRDIKPSNLFLTTTADGVDLIKVLDFGIARVLVQGIEDIALTAPTSVVGSPAYMAPELLRADRAADCASDIWSLGVVLYELLEGRLPFDAENLYDLCLRVTMEITPPLTRAPTGLAQVVRRCLEKDPTRRYHSVGALADALVPWGPPDAGEAAARVHRLLIGGSRPIASPSAQTPARGTMSARASGAIAWMQDASRWHLAVAGVATVALGLLVGLMVSRISTATDAVAGRRADVRPTVVRPTVVRPTVVRPTVVRPAVVSGPDAGPPSVMPQPEPTPASAAPSPPSPAPAPPRRRKAERPSPSVYESRR